MIYSIIKHGRQQTPAPQPPPQYTTSGNSCSTCATVCTSSQPVVPPIKPIQPAPMPQLNWSHFKPEFADKPYKDVEVHLIRINDTHVFPEGVKVQQFCLTLVGEVRLRYESLRPIALDWNGYKISFNSNTLKWTILGNNYFMHGDPSISTKMLKH